MKLTPIQTSVFEEKQNLADFIVKHIPCARENTVLAVASKLICLWKGCAIVYKSKEQKEALIKQESEASLKTPLAWLTLKNGMLMTNAGIDESNAKGKLLFFPKDMYACADELREELCLRWGIKNVGILITDSMILPLRAGVVGAAVAYAGFKGVKDCRNKPDIFGKPLEVTLVDAADCLASASALMMGEGNECQPLCIIENAPVTFCKGANAEEIKYPPQNDLYTPLLQAVGLITKGENND